METNTRSVLAANIRHFRLLRGWSQEQLAEHCGLHRTYVGAIERGERNIGLDNLARLARALNVPASLLLTDLQPVPGADRVREPHARYSTPHRLRRPAYPAALQPALCRISTPMCYS